MHIFKSIITCCYHSLNHSRPLVSQLKSRSVIRFSGPDTIKYLQSLLTNDLQRFGGPPSERTCSISMPNLPSISKPPMYATLLTAQGRFLYDFFLYRPPGTGEKLDGMVSGPGPYFSGPFELFADVAASLLDEILQTLKKYRLRSKVEIDNVAEDFSCWQRFGGNLERKSGAMAESEAASVGWGSGADGSAMSASLGNDVGWQWFKDPRLDCLGFRGIFPSDKTPPLVQANEETDEQNYLLWRIENGVAEGSSEIQKGEAIPLEYNFVGLNAISFEKGCYVGQELIARTHHRGTIRKRLIPLRFSDDGGKESQRNVAPGSEVINTTSSKKVGSVTTALGSRGLGLLRIDEAFRGSGSLAIQGQEGIMVETIRPKWWPTEWLPENQEQRVVV